jgi:hypothetical protein
MKSHAHLIGICLLALAVGGVRLAGAPAKPAAKPAAPQAEVPAPTIEGITIERPNGFLGLNISDNHFVLTFYDAKRQKTAPDVARAALRWPVPYQKADERTVLNPSGDGVSLSSLRNVRPPHTFKVFLSLFAENGEEALENYVVDYHD